MSKAETIREFLQIGSTYAISDFEDFNFDDFFQEQPDRLKIASLDKNLNNKLIKDYVIIEHCGCNGS